MNLTSTMQDSSGKANKINRTIGYYAAFIALGLTTSSMGPTLPGLAQQTGSKLGQVSILFTARSLGYLLGSYRGGRFFDRFAGHHVLVLSLISMMVMMMLTPTVPLLWLLAALMVAQGFGEGMLDVGGNALLVWTYKEKVGPFMNGLHFFYGIGAFLSPIIIAQALHLTGEQRWAFWTLALCVLPVIFWMAKQPSPAIPDEHQNGGSASLKWGLILIIAAFYFLHVGASSCMSGWIFTYAKTLYSNDAQTAAYLTSAFWGALTVSRLIGIPLAAKLHPRVILAGDIIGSIASLGVIMLWPQSLTALWIGTMGTGLFMATIFPTTITLLGQYLPISGRSTGYFFMGGSLGSMFLPWVIGQLFEPVGSFVAILITLLSMMLSLVMFVWLMARLEKIALRPVETKAVV